MPAKNSVKVIISLCALIFVVAFLYSTTNSQGGKEIAYTGDFKPYFASDRVVIKFYSEIDKSKIRIVNGAVVTGLKSLDDLNARYKVSAITQLFPGSEKIAPAAEIGLQKVYRIEFPEVPDVRRVVETYANDANIEYAQPVGIHKVNATIPNDPYFSNQWGMTKIHAPEAWDITHGDSSILLAIVDTGVDWMHPDLGIDSPYVYGNIWTNWVEYFGTTGFDDDGNGYIDDIRGWDWVNVVSSSYPPWPGEDGTIADNDPRDFNGHGTHCSGIASAITNNSIGVAGVGWGCKIMPLRAGWSANYYGYEVGLVDMSFCAQGIYYAASNGAAAVNCSWGSSNTGGIADAVTFASSMGTVVVSSAGNDDLSDASYLCSRHDVVSVAATNPTDNKASYSSYGFWVDVAAPGGDYPPTTNEIYSTYYDHVTGAHTYEWLSGTSMAAPHVVGLIGLVNDQFPGLTWQGIKERLQYTSDNIDLINSGYKNGLLGEGRINAYKAVNQIDLPSMATIFTENFDAGLPTTWTADINWRDDDPGNRNTDFDDNYVPGTIQVGYDIWTPPFMIVDSDYEGTNPIDASLISPIIDCSIASNVRLVFNNWFQNYGGGNLEQGDIEVRINNGPWQTVASFIDNGSYNVVDAGRDVVVRLPSSVDYQGNVQIRWHYYNANYDWFWGIDNVKLIGEVINVDYYVRILPDFQIANGDTGSTVSYRLKVMNLGLQSDSYDLTALKFSWPTTIWDSAGAAQLSNTGVIASRDELDIMAKVEIPIGAVYGDVDSAIIVATSNTVSSVFDEAILVTRLMVVDRIPWFEDFPTMIIDTLKWSFNRGPAEINTIGLNPPSPPYSLNLDGDALGGDEIHSCVIDLSRESGVILSYYYQRAGGGNSPETGEDLWVDYLNSSGTWVNLKQHPGGGIGMTNFEPVSAALPADAYHGNFKIRFRNLATTGNYDDWFIDDVFLAQGPDIDVTINPDSFAFTLDLGDSTTATMTIRNTGGSNLEFDITDIPVDTSFANRDQLFTPAIQDILIRNYKYSQQNLGNSNNMDCGAVSARGNIARRFYYTLEQMLSAHQNNSQGRTIKAVVIDGYGTDSSGALDTWDYLNLNYNRFGSQSIVIDYTTLNKENISYQDIATTGADILIISDNWGYTSDWFLTVDECNAIVRYVNEGHGLYISAGTFDNYDYTGTQPQVDYLAELVGINPSMSYYWTASYLATPVSLVKPNHPVFRNVPNPYQSTYSHATTIPMPAEDWSTAISTGELLAISSDKKTAIIGKSNRIYHSSLPECSAYGIDDDDYQFLYNVITFAASQAAASWLSYDPASGTVAPDSSLPAIVDVKVRAIDLLPNTTYYRDIYIANNDSDPLENPWKISASLTVNPTDYYFTISPLSQDSTAKAGDSLFYKLRIKNYGLLTDSYNLAAQGNDWPTTFWDSTRTTQITNVGPVPSGAIAAFMARVEIPGSSNYGDADTVKVMISSVGKPALSRFATIGSFSVGTPVPPPWSDYFPSTTLDPDKWIYNAGPAEVNDLANNEPSPPYSLNLNGYNTGGDEVRSTLIDLSNDSLVILGYKWERGGTQNPPEFGDNLWVDYLNASGSWINLMEHVGNGYADLNFTPVEIALPADAYHNAFQVRFRSRGDASIYYQDDWFVDDVIITRPPVILVNPESYDVQVRAGESEIEEPPLTITNLGEGVLRYRVSSTPSFGADQILQFEPATRDYPENYFSKDLGKSDIDLRKGAPVVFNAGGPDNFGYTWIDSDDPGGPIFNWVDISTIGTQISGLGDDTNVGPFPISFAFDFYGNSFTMFRFCTNGFISFTSTSSDLSNEPIPNQSVFDLIAPFWDDLNYDYTSSAYYYFDGQKLIIQCNNVLKYGTSERNSFEIFLYNNGMIKLQYLTMQSSSSSATVGIQNDDGSDGLEIAFNSDYVHDNLAIQISTGVSWLEFDKTSGELARGEADTIQVTFNARDIHVDSLLEANISISSNDPLHQDIPIPAKMQVVVAELITGTIFTATGNPLGNAVAQAWDEYPNGTIMDQDTTGADGKYLLALPPVGGIYTVRAYANDYIPAFKKKIPGDTFNVNFALEPAPSITPTTEWVDFYSGRSIFWDGPVQVGDIITAEDPDSVVCGIFTVRKPGDYGFMPVYRDDDTTPDIDEGAQPGDTIAFRINGWQAITLGPDSPVWTSHGSIRNVDLYVARWEQVVIPLTAGWNLVSWFVDTPMDSTQYILKDILANVIIVLSFENGGLTYKPDLPGQSNLLTMDHLHGYWIKMTRTDTLKVLGNPANYLQTPIDCEKGWNLVSYLPEEPDSVAHAFGSVLNNIVRAYGFKNGAMTFDPAKPEFSTLHVVGPTYGYWIYLMGNDTLNYPDPIPGTALPYEDPLLLRTFASAGQNWSSLMPTNEWINIYGKDIKLDGKLLPIGTRISARDPNDVTCGEFVISAPGEFGFMPVYRDDPGTDIDEGARPGDEISIYFNDLELPVKVTWRSFGDAIDLGALITSVVGELRNIPKEYNLSHNYPNPFNPETTIKFQLPKPGNVTLNIYNMLGQLVRTLVAEEKKAGYYQVVWDGRDNRGILVANGIYLYQFKAGNYEKTRKMVMLK